MSLLLIKSLHIIFVISWFAGLFYIVRLFIYHVEAQAKSPEAKEVLNEQFQIMEYRLMYAITMPAMVFTVLTGAYMLYLVPAFIDTWLYVKLGFVFGILLYHFSCVRIIKLFKQGVFNWTSIQLRLYNEVATLLLVAVIFLVVMKDVMSSVQAMLGFVLFAALIFGVLRLVKKSKK